MLYRLIIGLFLRLPWWIYVGFAIGMGNLTYNLYNSEFEKQQLGLARAEQPAPQSVDLSKFDPERDIHPLDEVHVRGWPDFDYNYQLIKKKAVSKQVGDLCMSFSARMICVERGMCML